MQDAQTIQQTYASDTVQVLTFDLQDETFALDASMVREVLDLGPETPVPGAAPFVSAVINFRGRVIPLADLRLAFGLECGESTLDSRIVVVEHDIEGQSMLIGLRADKVHEVRSIPLADTEEAPRVGLRWRNDFIQRLAKQGGELVIFPDLAQVFAMRGAAGAVNSSNPS